MRVIGGALRGRRLVAPGGKLTRPTSDRVREAVFSILGRVEGAVVLDLFAGSGALGIEALSRGAASAAFVERSVPALRVLAQNLASLGLEAPAAEVFAADALAWLGGSRRQFDVVFVDPPYAGADGVSRALGAALAGRVEAGGRVVCESDRRSPLALELPLIVERRYGDTMIRVYEEAA